MKMTRSRVITWEDEIPKTLAGFRDWEFSSGSTTGGDFKVFARLFREAVKRALIHGARLVDFSAGHYDISGFIEKDGRFVYFSTSDVRGFSGEWHSNILIRTAKHQKDYTGGSNGYTTLERFSGDVATLLGEPYTHLL